MAREEEMAERKPRGREIDPRIWAKCDTRLAPGEHPEAPGHPGVKGNCLEPKWLRTLYKQYTKCIRKFILIR